MADAITVSGPISGTDRTLSFSTGKLAGQADGAVVARIGDTIVLATATAARKVREGTDFFPLTVDIEERMYAAGKIPGSFFRREGRATDQAILTARLIDRPLRPSFPEGFRNEVHVVGTILGADQTNPHDVLSINAASAALMISGIPFEGPIGAVRIAYSTEGTWLPHATYQEGDASTFELVVAGRALSEEPGADVAIVMVEAGGTERAFEYFAEGAPPVTEEVIANGLEVAKTWIRESIELQRRARPRGGFQAHHRVHLVRRLRRGRLRAGCRRRLRAPAVGERDHGQVRAQRGPRRGHRCHHRGAFPGVPRSRARDPRRGAVAHEEDRPQAHRRRGHPHRRARAGGHPPALGRGRPAPDRTRLGAVPARRHPGAERLHARHAEDEPAAGHDRHRRDEALHAPLQLPPLLHRGDRLHARAQAPRDRPRPACRAGAAARRPARERVPLRAAPRLRRALVERVNLDGLGLRVLAVLDGRRSARSRRPSAASPWASCSPRASTRP